jgi:hypothetical protein
MRRFLLAILVLLVSVSGLVAQTNISVKSLTALTSDTEASVARKLDSRDKRCALIKVRTPNLNAEERGKFRFQGDMGTEIFLEKATGELKLFLTEGARKLRIMHDDYGVLEYTIPIQIEGFKTYKMELMVDKGALVVAPVPGASLSANYVEINVEPADATIIIDDIPVTDGVAYLEIDVDHTLTVSKAMYHTHTQIIRASKSKKMVYDVKLTPAFGWLRIVSQPEGGATVFIDGMEKGKTPFTTARMESGEHTVRLIKEMFEPLEKTVNVRDNDTATVTLKMRGNFAEVTLNIEDIEAEIYIDGKKRSDGPWNGRLSAGTHLIEAKRQYHTSTMKEITCAVGVPLVVTLDSPNPIIGSLNIKSNPSKAKIYLDGNDLQRTTPDIIQDIYAGEHRLKIEKEGYSTYDETIIVKENEITMIDVDLASTKEVTIWTDQRGDKIYVDGQYVGTSPVKTTVKYGDVKIGVERGDMKENKHVVVNDETSNIRLNVGTKLTVKSKEFEPFLGGKSDNRFNRNASYLRQPDQLFIDNKKVGTTPYEGTVSKGEHTLMFKNNTGFGPNSYRTREVKIFIADTVDNYQYKLRNHRMFVHALLGIKVGDNSVNQFGGLEYEYKILPNIVVTTGFAVRPTGFVKISEQPVDGTYYEYTKYKFNAYQIPLVLKLQGYDNWMFNLWVGAGLSFMRTYGVKNQMAYNKKKLNYTSNLSWSKAEGVSLSSSEKNNMMYTLGIGCTFLWYFNLDVYYNIPYKGFLHDNDIKMVDILFSVKIRIR